MQFFSERRVLGVLAGALGAALLLLFVTTRWLAIPWAVEGRSMSPTLEPGDRVLVDLWSYRHRPPAPGELVLLRGPGGIRLVKRVAQAGDGVIRVLGDNPAESTDSREFGPVGVSAVEGRVFFRYWPLSSAGPIR